MAQVSKDPLDVSSDFIESGKSLKNTSSKRSGPYSKDEKIKRQNEVHRLHFEYGYSARKIAELMKVNRNTINDDIIFWYNKISHNDEVLDIENSILVIIQRFNVQRSRLRESLDKAENFQQKHAIERMIFDIDSKILNTRLKMENSVIRIQKFGIEYLNNWLKKNKKNERYMALLDTISLSEKAHQRISKIIKEDRKKIGV
ncbi:hypothetical protein Nisw_06600 [Candidatus Nitrosopumilus sp. SW]|uniref:hypothetical protein n=1 Tax=Candidatus Nitrosopumilus sp. SW TaxID=2508726 RepID=UPI00114D6884|nr:hypothetical protein [Candidatus Nitrosopumilus sp. SW]QDI89214.1 hypothetical protein Nisw_06600 [Candidatus Nitrosopumilus sp. SW]